MATNFPGSQDNFTNPTSSDTLDSPDHAAQHANVNDAVEAIQGALLDGAPLHIDDGNERVGIGTSSPDRLLDIRGASNPEIRLQSTDSSDPFIYFGDQVDAVRGGIGYDTSEDALLLRGYNNNTRMTIASNGDIGVGTDSPSVKLEVADGTNAELRLNDTGGTVGGSLNAKIALKGNGSEAGVLGFNNTGSGIMTLTNEDGPVYLQTKSNDSLLLRTNNSTRLTIDGSGDATFTGDVTYANQGLVLLSDTTISSGSSSVTVSSVFSSTYENYKIVFSKIYGTNFGDIRFKFVSGGSGYFWSSRSKSIQGSTDDDNGNYFGSGTDWWIGYSSTNTTTGNGIDIDIYSPNDGGFTGYSGTGTGGGYHYSCGGYKNGTTNHTGFRINPASGTFSGGEIRVYGIKGT